MNALVSNVLTQVFITLIAVSGIYVLTGLTGMFSLGQAAFMAIGSYVSGLLVIRAHVPFALAALLAVAGATLIGYVIGYPVVRQAGDEFALQAVVGQRYGDVGLASAVAGAEEVRLVETQVVGRRETQHDLPEGNDLLSVHDFCEIGVTNIHKKPDNRKPDCARFGKGFR